MNTRGLEEYRSILCLGLKEYSERIFRVKIVYLEMMSRIGFVQAETDHLVFRLTLVLMSVHIQASRSLSVRGSWKPFIRKKY